MSIIAVSGFPPIFKMKQAVISLAKVIRGPFEALNFDQKRGVNNTKTLYIRVSEKMDPQVVLQRLKSLHLRKCNMRAYIPDKVPDLPLATGSTKPPVKLQDFATRMMLIDKPEDIMAVAHGEILAEMQYKYTGLYELSKKNGHTLLEEITHTIFERLKLLMDTNPQEASTVFNLTKSYRRAHPHFASFQLTLYKSPFDIQGVFKIIGIHFTGECTHEFEQLLVWDRLNPSKKNQLFHTFWTIFERLKLIMDTNPQAASTVFNLTKSYRRAHPHFADFQLILTTLQNVQDLASALKPQITEQDITVVNTQPSLIGNIPYKKVKTACNKYTDIIVNKVKEHVEQLHCDIQDGDTEEEIAKKKVRTELKKLAPYMSTIIREVITDNFVPESSPYHKFRIYGEPFLPSKDTMAPFLNKYKPVKVSRSDRMYNLLKMYIPLSQYGSIMAMDGTVVGGAKLVIRPSEQTLYNTGSFVREMKAAVKQGYSPAPQQAQPKPVTASDDWNEPWE